MQTTLVIREECKMAKTVVILGGSYAGVHIAHYLLKQKIPDVKVILVSKVSHIVYSLRGSFSS